MGLRSTVQVGINRSTYAITNLMRQVAELLPNSILPSIYVTPFTCDYLVILGPGGGIWTVGGQLSILAIKKRTSPAFVLRLTIAVCRKREMHWFPQSRTNWTQQHPLSFLAPRVARS